MRKFGSSHNFHLFPTENSKYTLDYFDQDEQAALHYSVPTSHPTSFLSHNITVYYKRCCFVSLNSVFSNPYGCSLKFQTTFGAKVNIAELHQKREKKV